MTFTQTDAERNTATIRKFPEMFSTGDLHSVRERLDDPATCWVSGKIEGFAGTESKAGMGKLLEPGVPVCEAGALLE